MRDKARTATYVVLITQAVNVLTLSASQVWKIRVNPAYSAELGFEDINTGLSVEARAALLTENTLR